MNPLLLLILIVIANLVIYWIFFGQKKFNQKYGHNCQGCQDPFGCHTNPADQLKELVEKAKNDQTSNKRLNNDKELNSKIEHKRGKK